MVHVPVLQKEVLEYLNPKPNENFIDCTIGEAGHTFAILEKTAPMGKVLGIDFDPEILKIAQLKFKKACKVTGWKTERLILVCDNFANLKEIVKKQRFSKVSGILFDLGLSSWHLEKSGRGFSFLRDEPLIMRYNGKENQLTARDISNNWPERELEKILREYGQERFAKRIARRIIDARKIAPIQTTFQLVEIIKKAVPREYQFKRLHPATKTFQALRIAVNDELNNLKKALPQTLAILKSSTRAKPRTRAELGSGLSRTELRSSSGLGAGLVPHRPALSERGGAGAGPGGRIVVISFHSLEDKIVKNFFREKAKEGSLKILTKKPIKPLLEEIKINPRSRSAKLRAAQKIVNS